MTLRVPQGKACVPGSLLTSFTRPLTSPLTVVFCCAPRLGFCDFYGRVIPKLSQEGRRLRGTTCIWNQIARRSYRRTFSIKLFKGMKLTREWRLRRAKLFSGSARSCKFACSDLYSIARNEQRPLPSMARTLMRRTFVQCEALVKGVIFEVDFALLRPFQWNIEVYTTLQWKCSCRFWIPWWKSIATHEDEFVFDDVSIWLECS
jgi:hypothetical protein